ncbi:MAG: SUMF1/EgtB/PvdO family nonheme iron enzyme [Verrucomicrobiota bacterium]
MLSSLPLVAFALRAATPAVPAATATPETVAKPPAPAPVIAGVKPEVGKPFENSLGMKFAPVGPAKVLFGIWDVRVQDFEAFASAYGIAKIALKFEQAPTHPVVNVSWDEAQDFCTWLTQKEQAAGRLSKTQFYRLPTDSEWSLAVGLAEPADGGSPESKDRQINDVYPWGTTWPPPKGAGNYDASLETDTYLGTSPVGTFTANKYGLFDMGGNVWQWCEDFYDGTSGPHVVRGASYFNSAVNNLLLSKRDSYEANIHSALVGFRVVIADKSGAGL